MSVWGFLYIIGCGVSLIMSSYGLTDAYEKMPKKDRCIGGLIFACIVSSLLSWAVPIWWIGFEVYKRGEK